MKNSRDPSRARGPWLCLGALLVLCAPEVRGAEAPPPAAPTTADLETAKTHYQSGAALYEAGKYQAAKEAFEESYRLSRLPDLLFNLSSVSRKLNRPGDAVHYLERYLEARPAAEEGTITGTVRSPDVEAPLEGATITVEGTALTTVTDAAGRFRLAAPPGPAVVRADFGGFRAASAAVVVRAGAVTDVAIALSLDKLLSEVVVVVGARTPRSKLETTAPVDVVTAEDVARVGKTETGRVLATLAPSFVSTAQTIADGTDHVDPASLRGLGPDQVLVLVNGKRRHKSALLNVNGTFGRGTVGTDLNAIPAGSIKRIEILRDGAASQYGSDAIAGVINVVTKDYTELLELTSTAGVTGSGDGAQLKTSVNYGYRLGAKGFLNVTGELLKKDATNRAGRYSGPIFTSTGTTDDAELDARGLTRDDFQMKIGEAASEGAMGAYHLELPIDAAATFYSFGDVAHRSGAAAGFYRYPFQTTQNVPTFYPNGFLPEIHSNIDDLGVTLGVRRTGAWTVDASLTHGRNSFQFDVENSVNASLGTSSPTSFNAGTVAAQQTVADLDLVHALDTGGAVRALALVLGSEVRVENYKITRGDEASYVFGGVRTADTPPKVTAPGAQVFPGFQPANEVDRTRTNVGVYAGLESELRKGLHVDLGGRYEHYLDFGSSVTGKLAARAPLTPELAVRAAVSTGFRAPSLPQLWFSNVASLFIPDSTGTLVANQVLTSNNASPITRAFGIPRLKQETSFHVSGGVTVRPIERLAISADGYFVRLKDRITLTNQFTSAVNSARYAPVADILDQFPGVTAAQFFANAVDTDTIGLDVVADYALDLGAAGALTLGAAANFTRTQVQDVHIPASLQAAFPDADAGVLNGFFFDRLARNRLEDATPHQRGNVSARYTYHQLGALVRANYFGRVLYKPANPANDEVFGAKVLVDLDVSYQISPAVQLTVGADNLFNTFPDKNTKDPNLSFGRFVYNRNVSQFGQNGGFYYTRLGLTF